MTLCRYYHASKNELPVGTVLQAKPARVGPFEKLVDSRRPAGAPSRQASFFLGEAASGLLGLGASNVRNVYNVRTVGPHLRADAAWLVEASQLYAEGERGAEIDRLIESYWRGAKSPWFGGWEISAPTIVVCEKLDERRRVRSLRDAERKEPGIINSRIFKRMLRSVHSKSKRSLTGEEIARELGVDLPPLRRKRGRTP